MRLFPIISVVMRVAVIAKPTQDMEEDLLASDRWADSSDFDSSDSDPWADSPREPEVKEETKRGKLHPTIRPGKVSTWSHKLV